MFGDDYRKLMDSFSASSSLEQRTEREINQMLHPTRKQKQYVRRMTIAAIAALLIAGTAFAAVHASGILELLFLYSEPSQTAREAVIRDSKQVSKEGVTLNIDEYLFDNNTVHLGWTVSSDREKPVYYTTYYDFTYTNPEDEAIAEESAGGIYGASSSGEVGDSVMVRLSEEMPFYSGFASYGYNADLNSTVNTRVIIHAYETDCAEVALSIASVYDIVDDTTLADELETAGWIGYTTEGQTSIKSYAAFNEALEKLENSGMEWDAANEAALVESGFFKELAVLELNVEINPRIAVQPRFKLNRARTFELSDATVVLNILDIDTASTVVEYEVITDKEFNEANPVANNITYILFDQDGNPLNVECSLGMSAGRIQKEDGREAWLVSLSGNPIPESVTSITFVPTLDLERQQESSNNYYRRMKQAAAPEQCFTIDLS